MSVQNLLNHLNLLGDMSKNRWKMMNQPSYEYGDIFRQGNLVAAKSAIDTRFSGAFCSDLANNMYLEELQDLANRLELRITPKTTKTEICQMINRYVLDSELEPYYIDIETVKRNFRKMIPNDRISAGVGHSLALTQDGRIVGWGNNSDGQRDLPEEYKELRFMAVSAGYFYSLALTRDGRVVGWGNNVSHQIECPVDNDFVSISAGKYHSLALTRDGRIVAWGGLGFPQLINCPEGNNFVAISAGAHHSLALTQDGRIVGWGRGKNGEIEHPSDNNFVAISAGSLDSLALTRDGHVVSWNIKKPGQHDLPEEYKDLEFVAISAGYNQYLALTQDGRVVGWNKRNGQIINCPSGNNFVAISAGMDSLALTIDNRVIDWKDGQEVEINLGN